VEKRQSILKTASYEARKGDRGEVVHTILSSTHRVQERPHTRRTTTVVKVAEAQKEHQHRFKVLHRKNPIDASAEACARQSCG
jgi:hypothetical protein